VSIEGGLHDAFRTNARMETNRRFGLLRAGGFQRRDLRKAG
jgi:hypothetical protein